MTLTLDPGFQLEVVLVLEARQDVSVSASVLERKDTLTARCRQVLLSLAIKHLN